MLHITNGDVAGDRLLESGLPGEVLPWRDVLHEGPVPAGLSLAELAPVRARYIADRGWAEPERVLADFAARDARLAAAVEDREEVVLWFEHDLYDQLQLIQILDFFADHPPARERLWLICIDGFPGIERFVGLGQLTGEQLAGLFGERRAVTETQLVLGRDAWAAYRAPDPRRLEALLAEDTTALPFLCPALRRHLEQYPSTHNGLSGTQRQILAALTAGIHDAERIFRAVQEMEAAPFLGDVVFRDHLRELCSGEEPLVRRADHAGPLDAAARAAPVLVLTERGRAVREGRADWIRLRGGIDRWLGGVHLSGPDSPWRWDVEAGVLVGRATATGPDPPAAG